MRISRERWRQVPGWEDYEISTYGRVRSWKTRTCAKPGAILAWLKGPRGYPQVNLHKDGKRASTPVHQLVAMAYLGPYPEGQEVRHLDGNPGNPNLSNLRYGTPSENYEDARKHGTYSHGERHGKSTVTADDVREIRRLRREGRYLRELAALFSQSTTNISDICNRKTWTHLED